MVSFRESKRTSRFLVVCGVANVILCLWCDLLMVYLDFMLITSKWRRYVLILWCFGKGCHQFGGWKGLIFWVNKNKVIHFCDEWKIFFSNFIFLFVSRYFFHWKKLLTYFWNGFLKRCLVQKKKWLNVVRHSNDPFIEADSLITPLPPPIPPTSLQNYFPKIEENLLKKFCVDLFQGWSSFFHKFLQIRLKKMIKCLFIFSSNDNFSSFSENWTFFLNFDGVSLNSIFFSFRNLCTFSDFRYLLQNVAFLDDSIEITIFTEISSTSLFRDSTYTVILIKFWLCFLKEAE